MLIGSVRGTQHRPRMQDTHGPRPRTALSPTSSLWQLEFWLIVSMDIWKNRQSDKQVTGPACGLVSLKHSRDFLLVSQDPSAHLDLGQAFPLSMAAATGDEGRQRDGRESIRPGQGLCGGRCSAHQRGSRSLHADDAPGAQTFPFLPDRATDSLPASECVPSLSSGRKDHENMCEGSSLLIPDSANTAPLPPQRRGMSPLKVSLETLWRSLSC